MRREHEARATGASGYLGRVGFLDRLTNSLSMIAASQRFDAAPVIAAPSARKDSCNPGYASGAWNLGDLNGGPGLDINVIDALLVNQLLSRIVNQIIQDSMRDPPALSGPIAGSLDDLWMYLVDRHFDLQETRALSYARKYGGGALVALVEDGRAMSEPVNLAAVRSIRGFIDIDRQYITVGPAESVAVSSWWGPRYGRPSYYLVAPPVAGGAGAVLEGGARVHPSRVIPYRHRVEMNYRQSERWRGWGPGIVDAIVDRFLSRQRGLDRLGDVINSFGYDHMVKRDMDAMLEGPEGPARLQGFLRNLKACRDYTGNGVPLIVTGPDADIKPVSRTVSGLSDLITQLSDALLHDSEYTRIALYGETSSGLGSGAALGEWQGYYQQVQTYRKTVREPGIIHAAILCMAAQDGPTGGKIDYGVAVEWAPLAEDDPGQLATNRKVNAEAREIEARTLGIPASALVASDPSVDAAMPGIAALVESGEVVLSPVAAGVAMEAPALMAGESPAMVGPGGAAATPDASTDAPASPLSGPEGGEVAAPAAPPVSIPTDLVTAAQARRLLRCGSKSLVNMEQRGGLHAWRTSAGKRYSMAELYASFRGDSARMDPFANEHAAPQRSSAGLVGFHRVSAGRGVSLIKARPAGGAEIVQSIRFAASEWDPAEAIEWLGEHGYKTRLEPAVIGDE